MLVDLAAITGDASAQSLKISVGTDLEPRKIAASLDRLISRLDSQPHLRESAQIVAAHDILRCGGTVEVAAAKTQVDRRRLHRMFYRHLGVGPKMLADLERLQSSLRGIQTGCGDLVQGFSDQAHQIRSWRRRLGITPGASMRKRGARRWWCCAAGIAMCVGQAIISDAIVPFGQYRQRLSTDAQAMIERKHNMPLESPHTLHNEVVIYWEARHTSKPIRTVTD